MLPYLPLNISVFINFELQTTFYCRSDELFRLIFLIVPFRFSESPKYLFVFLILIQGGGFKNLCAFSFFFFWQTYSVSLKFIYIKYTPK